MSMRNYVREDEPMTSQQQINSDFDADATKDRGRWFVLGILFLAVVIAFCGTVAHAQAAPTATIKYTAPTLRTDGSTITGALTYEIWQGLKGQAKTKVGTISSVQTTITTGLQGGNEYCWDVVAIEAANPTPSAHSSEGCKAFAQAGPQVVTITVN